MAATARGAQVIYAVRMGKVLARPSTVGWCLSVALAFIVCSRDAYMKKVDKNLRQILCVKFSTVGSPSMRHNA